MADPKQQGSLRWHHAPLPTPLPACLYPFADAKAWITIPVPGMTYAAARGHSPARGSCWEGKASPRQGWPQPSPMCCGVWDVSVPLTSAHSGSLSSQGGTRSGSAHSLLAPVCAPSPQKRCLSRTEGLKSPVGQCVLLSFHIRTARVLFRSCSGTSLG